MMGRGQAALEFLTTYGWATIMALLFLLIILYFGVINPAALAPDRCVYPGDSGVECIDAQASVDGTLLLHLYAKEEFTLTSFSCRYEGEEQIMTRESRADSAPIEETHVPKGTFFEVACLFDGDNPFAGRQGEKAVIKTSLDITRADGALLLENEVRVPIGGAP